ncbi:uncharacterized protein HD556DRAFT_1305577 [Suillus plorans]|uniref:Guanine nucleotide-binding protein subunit beta-like protein n=1 Tax=Suillus plorans TaxID=116603 RepID=A0A9P7J296_9AGAM|nr:uncharacterized protein HD556DRAFT_1305577 [Suillus plorans]KAG1799351.1 hypothetical protein HD556DRAFT_1305577 [Suillus plorans]
MLPFRPSTRLPFVLLPVLPAASGSARVRVTRAGHGYGYYWGTVIADAILPACTLQPAPPPTPAPNAPSQVHQLHVHSARARNASTSVDAMQTHADDTRRRKDKRIEEGRRDGIEMKEERGTRGDETLGTLKQQQRRHMCHVASAYLCAPSTRTTTSFHANATIHDANATIHDADATILDANATIHDTNTTIHDTNTTIPSTTPTPTQHTDSPASSVHAQTTPANAGVARMHTEDTRTKREGKEAEREEEGMILSPGNTMFVNKLTSIHPRVLDFDNCPQERHEFCRIYKFSVILAGGTSIATYLPLSCRFSLGLSAKPLAGVYSLHEQVIEKNLMGQGSLIGARAVTWQNGQETKIVDLNLLHSLDSTWICCSPDELHIVCGSEDGTAIIWDTNQGNIAGYPIRTSHSHVYAVRYSSDGGTLATSGYNNTVTFRDVRTKEALHSVEAYHLSQQVHRTDLI